ncbi:MAG: ribonuclease H family protein [Candidatus Dormibacteria bacterium]
MTPASWVDGYCDGACSGNPGPGGWAFRLEWPQGVEEGFGAEPATTNNRMELVAARAALAAFAQRAELTLGLRLHTDSRNVIGWLDQGWKRRANLDLFPALDRLLAELAGRVQWVKVRGHRGNPGNDRVDQLAVNACRELRPGPPA